MKRLEERLVELGIVGRRRFGQGSVADLAQREQEASSTW